MVRLPGLTAACLAACLAGASVPAAGQSLVSTGESFVSVEILPGSAEADGSRMIGLVLDLAPEWKTYWRSPGEAGIPPRIDWSGSDNLADFQIYWPRPKVFESFGLTTIGYARRVVLPVQLTPKDPSLPITLDLQMDLGVCRDICVFESTSVARELPGGLAGDVAPIETALASVPPVGADAGLVSATCEISGQGSDRHFEARLAFSEPVEDAKVLLEGPDGAWFHETSSAEEDGDLVIASTVTLLFDDVWLTRKDVRMTLLAEDWAADIQGCSSPQKS